MAILLATQRAVSGINCIRPEAPTLERASVIKRTSSRINPYTQAGSKSIRSACADTPCLKGAAKRWGKSSSSLVNNEVLTPCRRPPPHQPTEPRRVIADHSYRVTHTPTREWPRDVSLI